MTTETKLEACPFCGEEAELATLGSYQRGVVCTHCGAQMSYSLDPESKLAIAAWNTRRPTIPVEVEEALRWMESEHIADEKGVSNPGGVVYTYAAMLNAREYGRTLARYVRALKKGNQ